MGVDARYERQRGKEGKKIESLASDGWRTGHLAALPALLLSLPASSAVFLVRSFPCFSPIFSAIVFSLGFDLFLFPRDASNQREASRTGKVAKSNPLSILLPFTITKLHSFTSTRTTRLSLLLHGLPKGLI